MFGQDKISGYCTQEATYSLQLALMEWEMKARKLRPLVSWTMLSYFL